MKINIEKVLSSYFDKMHVEIRRRGWDSYSIHLCTDYDEVPQYINTFKKILMNPKNYPLIVGDLKLLLEEYVHGDK